MSRDQHVAPAILEIDLAAISQNYRTFQGLALPGCVSGAVVKANAYGLGKERVIQALALAGCRHFFVATLDEGLAARRFLERINGQEHLIYVLGGLMPDYAGEYREACLVPVLNTLEEIAAAKKDPLPMALHFDTGMHRLGLNAREQAVVFSDPQSFEGMDIRLIMSHFACADEKDHPMTEEQAVLFSEVAERFSGVPKSLANSSGAFRSEQYHYDVLRPGMGLYGLNPVPEQNNPMRPVIGLKSRILRVQEVWPRETIGYGATYRFDKKTRIATVALGYADGFLRSLSNRGILYVEGKPCPVIGRVSMDAVTIDLQDIDARPGDYAEVCGPHQEADLLAEQAGTIGYEILTSLGGRFHRNYVGEEIFDVPANKYLA